MRDKEFAKMYGPPATNRSDTEQSNSDIPHKKYHNLEPFTDSSRTRVLRFWLNVIFMIGAIAGLTCYYLWSHHWAIIILIAASVFKFVELTLRILKI